MFCTERSLWPEVTGLPPLPPREAERKQTRRKQRFSYIISKGPCLLHRRTLFKSSVYDHRFRDVFSWFSCYSDLLFEDTQMYLTLNKWGRFAQKWLRSLNNGPPIGLVRTLPKLKKRRRPAERAHRIVQNYSDGKFILVTLKRKLLRNTRSYFMSLLMVEKLATVLSVFLRLLFRPRDTSLLPPTINHLQEITRG